jgi:hypothetical protein
LAFLHPLKGRSLHNFRADSRCPFNADYCHSLREAKSVVLVPVLDPERQSFIERLFLGPQMAAGNTAALPWTNPKRIRSCGNQRFMPAFWTLDYVMKSKVIVSE